MAYYVTTPENLQKLASAVNQLAGLSEPVRGEVHGGPDTLPQEYEGLGTPGWTDAVFRGSWVSADFSQAAIEISDSMWQLAGETVDVNGTIVTFPQVEEAVEELPASLLEENGAFWWDGSPLDGTQEDETTP